VRRILSIALLLAYLSTVLSALIPLVYYISNQAYISQNLCENRDQVRLECNGTCYLNEQLSETTKKSDQENIINLEKYPELNSLGVVFDVLRCSHFVLAYPNLLDLYSLDYKNDVFHPPLNSLCFFNDFC